MSSACRGTTRTGYTAAEAAGSQECVRAPGLCGRRRALCRALPRRSEHGASLTILRMAEITLIQALTCQQVIVEAERNLADKLPTALPAFRLIVSRCFQIVADPAPADLAHYTGHADPEVLPILVAAQREDCPWLVSFNVRHFRPGVPTVTVLAAGRLFVLRVRDQLSGVTHEAA